ncbi:MAG: hypothetical protein ABSH39_13835 [Candidatus Acidiferrum sp.]|jgi:hypothetical protein
MTISPVQNQGAPVEPATTSTAQPKPERNSIPAQVASANAVEKPEAAADATTVAPLARQTDVTLKRDSNGRIYYSVSDAKSGAEILEVPPKALRDVSQGIEDYLKEEQSKAGARVSAKA